MHSQTEEKKINAGWEVRAGRSICRWILVWEEVSKTEVAGCAAGYSGGGAFQLEKFHLKYNKEKITSLQIDNEEKINSTFVDFIYAVPSSIREICEDCQDEILSWHDRDRWEYDDNLQLRDEKIPKLYQHQDMLFFRNSDAGILLKVLECLGLTSKPML